MSLLLVLGLLAALVSPAVAQTWTACNPLNRTDCPRDPALSTGYTWNFTNKLNDVVWNTTAGTLKYGSEGAEFTIAKKLESPTIQSKFYIFFGILEIHMKAAPGKGIVSSIVLQSDDLDEVDWEWVGGDTTHVQTNYFGKGNTTTYDRGAIHEVNSPMDTFHNYTVHWTAAKIDWYIDGNLTRTLYYGDAVDGKNYPQTPMTVRLGIWPGGDPGNSKGTVEWAGGPVDYAAGPYSMVVKQMKVTDFSSGKEYEYGDKSGSWQSINIINGTSPIAAELAKPPPKPLSQKWAELPNTAKIAVYSSVGGVALLALSVLAFCCIKQRRAGRKEFNIENSKFTTEQNNVLAMQSQWRNKSYQEVRST